ncbi:hypothetical protein, conserved [Leishmania donovani]|uniref:Uncharacterized protein n=1 Tax=Leishmania donovani TaxID=5661 RepID=E9BK74_LEIDO|nr:hypothetical protein, conserved [Leishmania donovani]TPP54193.1 hypothetical protein CGC21_21760 [Leishmania donovani]CBZ35441.1 hypothetical protein, conserved [Leishmania donovani]
MADVQLSNSSNVKAVYAGHSLSLFMDLRPPAEVLATCSGSVVEDLPVTLSVMLRRIHSESETPLSFRCSSSHRLLTYVQCEDGAGGDAVQLGMSGNNLLKVTIDLATFPDRLQRLAAADVAAAEHALLDQSWVIGSRFRLSMQLRTRARAEWPPLVAPQWSESSDGCLVPTPCSHHMGNHDSAGVMRMREEFAAKGVSASPSIVRRNRPLSLYDKSAPRSQLKGPVYIDQELFPIVRILFVPQLYTEAIPTATAVLRSMTVQVGVERCRESRGGKPLRRALRDRSTKDNVAVLDRVPASSSTLDEESKALLQPYEAICLAFNAHVRQPSMTSVTAYDVAHARRLVVQDYTFEVMVTAARMKSETVETVQRAIQAYQYESGDADVLGMNLDEAVSSVEERFGYMKDAPSVDLMSFHHVVWEAMRACMVADVTSSALANELEDELDRYEDRINEILMDM